MIVELRIAHPFCKHCGRNIACVEDRPDLWFHVADREHRCSPGLSGDNRVATRAQDHEWRFLNNVEGGYHPSLRHMASRRRYLETHPG